MRVRKRKRVSNRENERTFQPPDPSFAIMCELMSQVMEATTVACN